MCPIPKYSETNIFLGNQWVNNEIKNKVRKYFELNLKNYNTTYQIGDVSKQYLSSNNNIYLIALYN